MTAIRYAVICLLLCPVLARGNTPSEDLEKYDDGTIHFKVPLDSQGNRNGVYIAYFPGGKKVQERSTYVHGRMSGARQVFDEKGALLDDQGWVQGRLVLPKSQRMIQASRQRILHDAVAGVLKLGKISNPNAPSRDILAQALARVNTYRYLCDVPCDVGLNDDQINRCQYAAELLAAIGHLTHNPDQPVGYEQHAFELGRDGCGRSNLMQGGDAVASVGTFMNDSDDGNIDRVGHRRWVLNPGMATTGFGTSGVFSAMFSFDHSRSDIPDYDFVCYPPRGYCPHDLFNAGYAWHVSFNPSKYQVSADAKIEIYQVDSRLNRSAEPLEMNYGHVDLSGYGIPNAIIGRPKNFAMRPGVVYEVVVSGVTKEDKPADVSYFVTFY